MIRGKVSLWYLFLDQLFRTNEQKLLYFLDSKTPRPTFSMGEKPLVLKSSIRVMGSQAAAVRLALALTLALTLAGGRGGGGGTEVEREGEPEAAEVAAGQAEVTGKLLDLSTLPISLTPPPPCMGVGGGDEWKITLQQLESIHGKI